MRRQIGKLERLQDNWVEKAELALSKGRDDLAKAALFEKQKAADMADQLKAEIDVLDDALRASEADIAKLQSKLREARARQNAVMTRMESAQNRTPPARDVCRAQGRRRLLALRRARAPCRPRRGPCRRARASARAPKTLEEEISELRNADKVDAELEALKASLAKRTNGGEAAKKGE